MKNRQPIICYAVTEMVKRISNGDTFNQKPFTGFLLM